MRLPHAHSYARQITTSARFDPVGPVRRSAPSRSSRRVRVVRRGGLLQIEAEKAGTRNRFAVDPRAGGVGWAVDPIAGQRNQRAVRHFIESEGSAERQLLIAPAAAALPNGDRRLPLRRAGRSGAMQRRAACPAEQRQP